MNPYPVMAPGHVDAWTDGIAAATRGEEYLLSGPRRALAWALTSRCPARRMVSASTWIMAGAHGHRRRTSEMVASPKKAKAAPTSSRPHDGRRRRRSRSFRYGEQRVQRWPDRTLSAAQSLQSLFWVLCHGDAARFLCAGSHRAS